MKVKQKKLMRTLLVTLALLLLVLSLRLFVFHIVRVQGTSMEPTLRNGEWALVTSFDYGSNRTPERGDIVESYFPDRSGAYIKRVIGLPGEHIVIKQGLVYVNGLALIEPYTSGAMQDYEAHLGDDEYLLMGDNREKSHDGRSADMGFVHAKDIIGRVRMRLWPPKGV